MRIPVLFLAVGLSAACAPRADVVDPRAGALAGLWCLTMDGQSSTSAPGACSSVALVAVRGGATPARDNQLLAEGAISMFQPAHGEALPDGTPVRARSIGGDSVMLDFAAARGDYQVYLTGVLRRDTLAGDWRSVVGRSTGSRGRFVMTRQP